jgi:serine phosphatase RsbU (regulator of sigma subunit)
VKTLEVSPLPPFGLDVQDHGFDARVVEVGTEQLEPADHLLLYTDGVVEARSPDGELFGVPRLVDLITRNLAFGLTGAETMRRAIRALIAHQGSTLHDDATMLLAQWRPEHPESLKP